MKRNILWGLMIVSLIASIFVAVTRINWENSSPDVEIVLDWTSFMNFQKTMGQPVDLLLPKFKAAGVTTVALYEKTLKDYANENKIVLFHGQDLMAQYYLSGGANASMVNALYQGPEDLDNVYALFQDPELLQTVRRQMEVMPGELVQGTYTDGSQHIYILELENGETKVENIPLGFSVDEVNLATATGLKVAPRVEEGREKLPVLAENLQAVQARGEISEIIFNGLEIAGYPDRIDETAQILRDLNLQVGMIEPFIAYQEGIKELANKLDLNIVRVHSIKEEEMQKYEYDKVLDRYIRAAKERNVRVLYFKPFLTGTAKENPMMVNKRFLNDLQTSLQKDGFRFGVAKPFPNERSGIPWVIVISLGVFATGLLLLDRFIKVPTWLAFALLGIAVVGTTGIALKGYLLLGREMLALLAAIVLPSLAILIGYEQAIHSEHTNERNGVQAMWIFLKVTGITLIGVAFVIGLLSDIRYIYQISQFRGIKFTFIIPLLVVLVYYLKEQFHAEGLEGYKRALRQSVTIFNQPVRYSHVILLGLIGVAGLIYIGRTGNTPILPAPEWEMQLRDFLEDLFVYRPRFKEFAIGHPFMLFAFYYVLKGKKKLVLPLLILGSIGQLTVINTFSHIHTPLVASFIRASLAVMLGLLGGMILAWIYTKFAKSHRKVMVKHK